MTPLENLELAANSIQQPELHEEVCAAFQSYRNISLISAEFRLYKPFLRLRGGFHGFAVSKELHPHI